MKIRIVVFTLLLLSVIPISTRAQAEGWYLGGEFQLASLGDGIVSDIDSGYGFALDFGYRFSPRLVLDFTWGLSFHDEDGNDVEYMRFLGGGKLIFKHSDRLQPYLTLGYESHLIFRSILNDIDGSGFYAGAGGEYRLSETGSLDIGFKHSMWTGEVDISGTSEDVATDTLSISYKHYFTR